MACFVICFLQFICLIFLTYKCLINYGTNMYFVFDYNIILIHHMIHSLWRYSFLEFEGIYGRVGACVSSSNMAYLLFILIEHLGRSCSKLIFIMVYINILSNNHQLVSLFFGAILRDRFRVGEFHFLWDFIQSYSCGNVQVPCDKTKSLT